MDNQKLENPGDKVSKSFCVLPWIHLNTWPNGNVYPCCLTDWREEVGNLKDNTLEEINIQGRESFLNNGGEKFELIPCLNDNHDHIVLFENLVKRYYS